MKDIDHVPASGFGDLLWKSIAICALMFVLLWFTVLDGHAEPFAQAVRLSGLPPAPPPEVYVIESRAMREMACRDPDRCRVIGLFKDGAVFVTTGAPEHVLLHEYVHYLQWRQGGDAQDCAEWVRREQQAYRVQITALEAEGASTVAVALGLQQVTCR